MSQAEELLDALTESDLDPTTEEHIIIGTDRIVIVPEPLQRIAVQYDHNIETVTFDCPRYWDEHDLSTMYIYINYRRSDDLKGMYLAKNVTVDEENPNVIHFTWTIDQDVTQVEGKIEFLVCAMTTDSDGFQETHWNSEINTQMYVSLGLEVQNEVMERYPAVINDLLTRLDALTGKDIPIDGSLSMSGIAADAAVVGQRFADVDNRLYGYDQEIINVNSEINTINQYVTNHKSEWNQHKQLHTLMENAYSRMEGRIDGHDNEFRKFYSQYDLIRKYNIPAMIIPTQTSYNTIDLLSGTWTTVETNKKYQKGNIVITINAKKYNGIGSENYPDFHVALDGSTSTADSSKCMLYAGDMVFDMGEEMRPTFSFYSKNNSQEKFTLYGSNNNSTWTEIVSKDHTASSTDSPKWFELSAKGVTTYYRYFKVKWVGDFFHLYAMKITEYYLPTGHEYNEIFLDNQIDTYEKNMRVLLDTVGSTIAFNNSILPTFTNNSDVIRGISIKSHANSGTASYFGNNLKNVFDKNDSTYTYCGTGDNGQIFINTTVGIKPKKVRIRYSIATAQTINITIKGGGVYSSSMGTQHIGLSLYTDTLYNSNKYIEANQIYDEIIDINTSKLFNSIGFNITRADGSSNSYQFNYYEIDIIEGEIESLNTSYDTYININNLGNKLISPKLALNKKYELVYDGTQFNAKEV